MITSLRTEPLDSLPLVRETVRATSMNIIFDLCGVLFGGNGTTNALTKGVHVIRPIDPTKTLRLLHDCSLQGHRLFALSTWSKHFHELIKYDPWAARILSYFDDIILATETGFKKPDPRIFDHLLLKHYLDPRCCIFIDHKNDNLKGAAQAGIAKGILCLNFNITGIREDLELHGAL